MITSWIKTSSRVIRVLWHATTFWLGTFSWYFWTFSVHLVFIKRNASASKHAVCSSLVLPDRMQPVQPTTPRHSPSPWTNDGDKTHPVTPESPTLRIRSNPHALRREPAMILTRFIPQYSRPTNSLCPWYWWAITNTVGIQFIDENSDLFFSLAHTNRPINERGRRIKPSDLLEYRILHDFQTPSCLCASSPELNADTAHMEAAIFIFSGEYVAACASGDCRYWGTPWTQNYSWMHNLLTCPCAG